MYSSSMNLPIRVLPCTKAIIVVNLLLLVFFSIYGTYHFYRDPNSIFYDSNRAYGKQYSLHRENEALNFLRTATDTNSKSEIVRATNRTVGKIRQHSVEICAVIVTFGDNRNEARHPLEATIGSLLAGLTTLERKHLDLRVYIANSKPQFHPLFDSPLLSLADSVISGKDIASPDLSKHLADLEQNRSYVTKTVFDFSLALEHCYLESTAPHIALFEDDILAADGWFAQMQMALREVNTISTRRQQDWLDLRLFNDAKEIRWSAHKIGGCNIPILALALPVLILCISGTTYFLMKQLHKTNLGSRLISLQAVQTICLVSIPLFVILYFKTGYLSTMPRPHGVSVQPWGCCTQGEIFPRSRIPELITALRERATKSPADITVWDHASEKHLLRLVLDPPMVQHVGFSSILAPKRKKAKTVWSVAFEDLDAIKLQQDHLRIVKELYGEEVERFTYMYPES